MNRHTPGPYYASRTSSDQGLVISEQTGETIAVTYKAENALLLAAAPAMYALLERAAEYIQDARGIDFNDPLSTEIKRFLDALNTETS